MGNFSSILHLWLFPIFTCVDPNPQSEFGSGTTKLLNTDYNLDPDPQRCFFYRHEQRILFLQVLDEVAETHQQQEAGEYRTAGGGQGHQYSGILQLFFAKNSYNLIFQIAFFHSSDREKQPTISFWKCKCSKSDYLCNQFTFHQEY